MKKFLISASLISGMAFLFAGLGFALLRKPIESPEVAAWVQAIGSIAAIGGAVWIYRSQERQRRDNEMAAARITAANMVHRVALVQAELLVCIQWFSEAKTVDSTPKGFKVFGDRLAALPIWTQDELIRLAPLERHCGIRLAASLDRILGGRAVCKIAIDDPSSQYDNEARKRYAAAAEDQLTRAQKELSYVVEDLKAVIKIIVS